MTNNILFGLNTINKTLVEKSTFKAGEHAKHDKNKFQQNSLRNKKMKCPELESKQLKLI